MKVSICVPVYNGEDTLWQLYEEIVQAFSISSIQFEILFAFDNGKNESWEILKQLKEKDNERIRIFHFAKNYGQHKALLFCISRSTGDLIITMDEDLQHHPADILKLIDKQINGDSDVVYGNYVESNHSFFRNLASSLVRKIITGLNASLYENFSPFRVIKREIAIKLRENQHTYDFIDANIGNLTNNIDDIYVNHYKNEKRKSSYTWYKLARHILSIFIEYTLILRIVYLISLAFIGFSVFLYLLLIKYNWLYYKIFSIILAIGGMFLFIIGVILHIIRYNNSKYYGEDIRYFEG